MRRPHQRIDEDELHDAEPAHLVFDYDSYPHQITVLENLRGMQGWVRATELQTSSFEDNTHLFLAAVDADGNAIPDEAARKLESKRDEAWREYDDAAKIIEEKKDALIDMVEARLKQQTSTCELFTISFEIH